MRPTLRDSALSLMLLLPSVFLLGVLDPGLGTPTRAEELQLTLHPSQVPELREAFTQAMQRARSWAEGLELDAVALQAHEPPVKGKKKLAEMLDLQRLFYEHEDESERRAILDRVRGLIEQVRTPEYQNLADCPEPEFEANSLSYLRIYVLMDAFDLLEESELSSLRAVKPRLDEAMAGRGSWQRAMFARYYDQLGLEKPAVLEETALSRGIVERRVPLDRFDLASAYSLTHEVFVAFDYGRRAEQELFDEEDQLYLRVILLPLQRVTAQKRGFDLMGEVVSCNTYLGNVDDPSYREAVELMLSGQNEDGSWGDYESHRATFGDALEAHAYLHTTLVCVAALIDVFEREPLATP